MLRTLVAGPVEWGDRHRSLFIFEVGTDVAKVVCERSRGRFPDRAKQDNAYGENNAEVDEDAFLGRRALRFGLR